mmetsp:Transcript_50793/g.99564  ORF Transcript_50793/g.99564 Transcript_50793/m.99564 type:complete len:161 (-) Transcript_50793:1133-1615(-)
MAHVDANGCKLDQGYTWCSDSGKCLRIWEEKCEESGFKNVWDYFGLLGGIFLCLMMLPQLYKAYKTKSTGDLSWGFLFVYSLGLISYTLYAFGNSLLPLMIPSCAELVFLAIQVVMKCVYDRNKLRAQNGQQEEQQKSHQEPNAADSDLPLIQQDMPAKF